MPDTEQARRPRTAPKAAAALAAALILSLSAAPAEAADGLTDLRADLDALLADPLLAGADSGVVVRSLDNGDVLYQHAPHTPLLPASNGKLLTTAAALDVLGADHRFTTSVSAAAAPRHGVLHGDLHLVGSGDPSLTVRAIDRLAADTAAAGITEVTGNLVADDSWFDDQRLVADWEAEDLQYHYAPQISALTPATTRDLDTGVVSVRVTAGPRPGSPVLASLEPATDYVRVDNRATTGDLTDLDIDRALGGNTVTVTGSARLGGPDFTTPRTVHEPTGYTADLFARALSDHGVTVRGAVVRGRTPTDPVVLASRRSAELGALLVPFLKLSNNGHAEMLVKAIGRETGGDGSWAAGLAEVESALTRLGVRTTVLELSDGSGLSRGNRLSAALLADLLREAANEPWYPEWAHSFPVAGADGALAGGTLSGRMRGTPAEGNVRAKTGTLTGVSALSGYVTSADGEPLVFAIVNNGYAGVAPRPVQDAIAVRLARFSRTAPARGTGGRAASWHRAPAGAADHLECSWAKAC